MTINEILAFLAALFSMMNPIGGIGIFAGMTSDRSMCEARLIARNCAIASAATLLIVIWMGGGIFMLFGLDVDEIRAAGGLIVLLIGLNMIFNKEDHKISDAETKDEGRKSSIAVVPLAIPLVAGPGSMATVIVAAQHHAGAIAKIELSVATIAICALTGVLFAFSKPLANRLGDSVITVISRVMGIILMAIATGMLATGLKGMFPALGH